MTDAISTALCVQVNIKKLQRPSRMTADHFPMTTESNLVTLSRHVVHEQSLHKEASGDLTLLLVSLQVATKVIASSVRKAGIVNL